MNWDIADIFDNNLLFIQRSDFMEILTTTIETTRKKKQKKFNILNYVDEHKSGNSGFLRDIVHNTQQPDSLFTNLPVCLIDFNSDQKDVMQFPHFLGEEAHPVPWDTFVETHLRQIPPFKYAPLTNTDSFPDVLTSPSQLSYPGENEAKAPFLLLIDHVEKVGSKDRMENSESNWQWLQNQLLKPLLYWDFSVLVIFVSVSALHFDYWDLRDQVKLFLKEEDSQDFGQLVIRKTDENQETVIPLLELPDIFLSDFIEQGFDLVGGKLEPLREVVRLLLPAEPKSPPNPFETLTDKKITLAWISILRRIDYNLIVGLLNQVQPRWRSVWRDAQTKEIALWLQSILPELDQYIYHTTFYGQEDVPAIIPAVREYAKAYWQKKDCERYYAACAEATKILKVRFTLSSVQPEDLLDWLFFAAEILEPRKEAVEAVLVQLEETLKSPGLKFAPLNYAMVFDRELLIRLDHANLREGVQRLILAAQKRVTKRKGTKAPKASQPRLDFDLVNLFANQRVAIVTAITPRSMRPKITPYGRPSDKITEPLKAFTVLSDLLTWPDFYKPDETYEITLTALKQKYDSLRNDITVEQLQGLLLELTLEGYLIYNPETGTFTLAPRLSRSVQRIPPISSASST